MTEKLTSSTVVSFAESNDLWHRAKESLQAGQVAEAESLYKQALDKRIAALGEGDHTVSEIIDEIGVMYLHTGKIDVAKAEFQRALGLLEKSFYAGHYYLGSVVEHLGDCAAKEAKWDEAEVQYKRALEIYEKTLSADHRSILIAMHKLSETYRHSSKFTEAETVINKGLKQIDSPLGPAEEFRYELALLYQAQEKLPEAEAQFKLAIEGFRQRRNVPRLGTCLQSYSDYLKKVGRDKDAASMAAFAQQYKDASLGYEESAAFFPATLLRA